MRQFVKNVCNTMRHVSGSYELTKTTINRHLMISVSFVVALPGKQIRYCFLPDMLLAASRSEVIHRQ
jgi:hypothetical protein